MQVNLKQAEIISALKMYVASQGINLVGKDVEMVFTAGRKESGISVEITIEESDTPFEAVYQAKAVIANVTKAALDNVVNLPVKGLDSSTTVTAVAEASQAPANPVAAALSEDKGQEAAAETPAKPVSSLFS